LAQRKGVQCRLAILALYFMSISEDMEDKNWKVKNGKSWKMLSEHYKWQLEYHSRGRRSYPLWFVFMQGDPKEQPTNVS
jgi:hypothetical protein